MRLAECLNQSDIRNLRTIAVRHTMEVPLYSKNSLLQEILSRFSEPDYIAKRTAELTPATCSALLEIALDAKESYAREEMLALLKRSQGETEAETLLEELLAEGIVFASGPSTRRSYVCPTDIWRRLHSITSEKLRKSVQVSSCEPVVHRADGTALARDAVALLLYVARHEPKLTQDGVIFKRQQQQVLELMEIREDPLPQTIGWRFGYGRRFHDYPDRFALLYDHLYTEGCLLETAEGFLRAPAELCETYTHLTEDERAHRLFRYWLRSYRSSIPALPRLVARIAELTSLSWVYADSLTHALTSSISDYFYESKEQVCTLRILQMLVITGALMVGQGDAQTTLYKLSPLGVTWLKGKAGVELQTAAELSPTMALAIIQPTFELLVPPEGDALFGWDLQAIATLVQNDRLRHYEITRDSIYRGLQSGWSEERIVQFLHTISAYELPGNVERTVAGWCKEYGRIKVDICCVVTCLDEETATEVRTLGPLSGKAVGTTENFGTLFPVEEFDQVVATFKRLGYLVQVRMDTTDKI